MDGLSREKLSSGEGGGAAVPEQKNSSQPEMKEEGIAAFRGEECGELCADTGLSEESLLDRLLEYSHSDDVPMHMPGHKRQARLGVSVKDVFSIDITEIPGFDDLHHPEGILRASLDMTRRLYGSFESFYSVNGSTACVLSALGAAAGKGGRVLAASNRHWSVDNAAELFDLQMEWLAPEWIGALGVCGAVSPEALEVAFADGERKQKAVELPASAADKAASSGTEPACGLQRNEQAAGHGRQEETGCGIAAVLVVSPSYEGVVSDIRALTDICHAHGALLIVDAAHGAHFHYSDAFPVPATRLGADIVIESVHKTLPSMTQTALLHLMRPDAALRDRIKHYLDIFVSSSPSYVLMASIDSCIRRMNSGQLREQTARYVEALRRIRAELGGMRCLKLLEASDCGAYALDISRLTVVCRGYLSGHALAQRLRERYHVVVEKETETYIIAISTIFDTEEGLARFRDALMETDHDLLSDGEVGQR